jgi:hypothetical protein
MAYLIESEITTYCTIPGITMNDIENASLAIDGYKGMSFYSTQHTETAKLLKRRTPYGNILKGKLKHIPRISVVEVKAKTIGIFGGLEDTTYDPNCLIFDEDDLQYFTFIEPQNIKPTIPPQQLVITYTAGYETIPDSLKRITGLIADSIKRNGGFNNWKARSDFDMQIQFSEQGILTNDIKRMIDAVKLI